MKKYAKNCVLFLLSALMILSLACCGKAKKEGIGTENTPEKILPGLVAGPVSPIRTGTKRQGIRATDGGFEYTENGVYFMCWTPTGRWLLYSDHGSDVIIKLCGRPDCTHEDKDCNAYFESAVGIAYYEGYLYTATDKGVYRLNIDGTERLLVFDLSALKAELGAKGTLGGDIVNGVFLIGIKTLNENGETVTPTYYYKLDGSMKTAEKADLSMLFLTDGDVFLSRMGYDEETGEYLFGIWDPDTNTTTELFRRPELYHAGFYGKDATYYMEDGIIWEYRYETDSTKALCDTGLEGYYSVICFPDVVIVTEYLPTELAIEGVHLESISLHFYDWNFNDLGSVIIDYPYHESLHGVICGETPERIILTDSIFLVPHYYIEKSDLGTGNIVIHEYERDFELE